MTNIVTILAVVAALAVSASATVALAGSDSPFYPAQFQNPNPPHVSVGAGSGIPAPYRLGD